MNKTLFNYFSEIQDPRVNRTKVHLLEDIIIIAILSVICGAETWNDMEEFGKAKLSWLKTFSRLEGGIPSHDTFNRVFSLLDPTEVENCFIQWTSSIAHLIQHEVISIDGKTMRGSRNKKKNSVVHMVSAWASTNNIVLGQLKVDAKSNEITAIPELVQLLVLENTIVTIDAMGCQKDIAAAIIDKKADYILALKGNQGNLLEQTEDSFCLLKAESVSEEIDAGHGRVERRTCSVISDLSMIEKKGDWKKLKSLIRIDAERYIKSTGKTEKEQRYYISSLPTDAELLNKSVKFHWGVENKLHWTLDVAFNEDNSRKRQGYAAQNFSVLCRIALNLLKKEATVKYGIKCKRLKAGWDNDYLLKLLEI